MKKMPLINLLASGPFLTTAVLEIKDCSKHLEKGGIKDAEYIAGLFGPHLERLDPDKDKVDLVLMDGAVNVQKAGEVIEASYPRVNVLHAAEHVVSLFFADLLKHPHFYSFVLAYRKIYGLSLIHI